MYRHVYHTLKFEDEAGNTAYSLRSFGWLGDFRLACVDGALHHLLSLDGVVHIIVKLVGLFIIRLIRVFVGVGCLGQNFHISLNQRSSGFVPSKFIVCTIPDFLGSNRAPFLGLF